MGVDHHSCLLTPPPLHKVLRVLLEETARGAASEDPGVIFIVCPQTTPASLKVLWIPFPFVTLF